MATADDHQPHAIDLHVGGKIRMRRKILSVSQEELGDALGLTFQQVQKYERGANRVSASKLYLIARALKTTTSFFFPDDEPGDDELGDAAAGDADELIWLLGTAGGLDLARLFVQLRGDQRGQLVRLAETIVELSKPRSEGEAIAA